MVLMPTVADMISYLWGHFSSSFCRAVYVLQQQQLFMIHMMALSS